MKAKATHITADVNGNVYFLEDEQAELFRRALPGIYFIPAGKNGITGAGDGSAEAQMTRIDPGSNTAQFSGITLDAAGNIYVASQSDSNGGAFNGDLMIPNISGSPVGVNASSFNFNAATFITPVTEHRSCRYRSSGISLDTDGNQRVDASRDRWRIPGTMNVVLWQMGGANVGTSPVGTAGTPGTVYFNFSQSVTLGSLAFSQPGTGSDFMASSTNPLGRPGGDAPAASVHRREDILGVHHLPLLCVGECTQPG